MPAAGPAGPWYGGPRQGSQQPGGSAVPTAAGHLPRRPATGTAVRSAPVRPAPVRAAPRYSGPGPCLPPGPGNRPRLRTLCRRFLRPLARRLRPRPGRPGGLRLRRTGPGRRGSARLPAGGPVSRSHGAWAGRTRRALSGRADPARLVRPGPAARTARPGAAWLLPGGSGTRRPVGGRPVLSARPAVPRSGVRRPVRARLGRARSARSGRPLPRGTRRPGRDVAGRPRGRRRSAGKPAARADPPHRRRSGPGADADDDLRAGKPGQPARRRRSRRARLAPVRRGGRRGARLRPVPRPGLVARTGSAGGTFPGPGPGLPPRAVGTAGRAATRRIGATDRRLHRAGPVSAGGGVPRASRLPRRGGRRRVRCARLPGIRIRPSRVRSPVPGFRRRAVPGKRRPGAAGSSRRRRLRPATRPAVSRPAGHAARLRA